MNTGFVTKETDINHSCRLLEDIVIEAAKKSLIKKTSIKAKKKSKNLYDEILFV